MKPITLSAAALLSCTVLFVTTACGNDESTAGTGDEGQETENGNETGDSGGTDNGDAEEAEGPADIDVTDVEGATLHTSEGDIEVELFSEETPLTVANFVGLSEGEGPTNPETGESEFYNDTVFHRVIDQFMIQGGDPEGSGRGGPGYQFEDEFDSDRTFDSAGMLAMANSGPDTNGSQFFITVAPTEHLNGAHTIFGQVTDEESQEVVDSIASVETDPNDRPVNDVTLETVSIQRAE